MTLTRISEHVYWMPPGPPDRPSLCAVVGSEFTLMLDTGASAAHARLFLDRLRETGISAPQYAALTHWHWDHVFGAAALRIPVIAHHLTAQHLAMMARLDWHDSALDSRVKSGQEIAFCAENIKLELPAPRTVHIAQPQIVFSAVLELHPDADVACMIQHVGGDHADDSCIMHIMPDRLVFLGDCLYEAIYAPARHFTAHNLFRLLDKVLSLDADIYIEGHADVPLTRAEMEAMAAKMRLAGTLVEQIGADEPAVLAAVRSQMGQPPDEDTIEFVQAFIAGHKLEEKPF